MFFRANQLQLDQELNMNYPLFKKVKMTMARWFVNPLGIKPFIDSEESPTPKILETTGIPKLQPQRMGGRGGKKEEPRRIDEFHLRGSAGRRESHTLKGRRNRALSHQNNKAK
jgi:hypothetical protein